MKQKLQRFMRQQNSGSAIVIVIVAMAFVGILASTLMWMSLMNFRMKYTERKIKESFYSAETVFEQIVVGLQNQASVSADKSYSFIMQNYANFSEDKRNVEFQKEYLKAMRDSIAKSSTETGVYDVYKLMLYVDAKLKVGIVDPSTTKSWIGARTTDSSLLGTADEYKSRYGEIVAPTNADYLILKGLHLEFTDKDGYLTIIDTDLMISTPEAGFTQSGRMANVFDYAIIADDSLDNTITAGYTTVQGNIYAGKNGVTANHKLIVKDADYFVSKGLITLHHNGSLEVGSGSDDIPAFWTKGITVDKDVVNGSTVALRAHSYVQDDLTVDGDNATVTLYNSYYGYGDSNTDVKESSAIIINGINNSLNFSGVKQLLLAGRAFTSIQAKSVVEYNSLGERHIDIPMSESIAVKGEQIAYLVPDECVGVLYGQSIYSKNPMSGKEYTALRDYKNNQSYAPYYKEVDVNRQLDSLGGRSLASYGINENTGIEKVFVPSNGETMVYYYLKFADSKKAEAYFADYYEVHKDKLDRYLSLYASGGIRSNTGFTRLTTAGDYFTATDYSELGNNITLHASTDNDTVATELEEEITSYRNTFEGLTTALTTNYLSLTAEERARQEVFENIIMKEQLELYVGSGTKVFTAEDGSGVKAILTGEASYVFDGDPNVVLIIATGDVVINSDFEGIVISNGIVTLDAGAKVTSAKNADKMSELARILQSKHSESDTTRPLDFVRNADSYILAGTALIKDADDYHKNWVDFADIVHYQNWSKH